MVIPDDELQKLLLENQLATEEQLKSATALAERNSISLYDAVLERDIISDEELGRLVSDAKSLRFVVLGKVAIPDTVLRLIPEDVARKNKIIAFSSEKDGVHVAMADPADLQMKEFIAKKTGLPVVVYYATERDISTAMANYSKDVAVAFEDIIAENVAQSKTAGGAEPPIIKIVDTIIRYAYQNQASDVHIEPAEDASLVRFRVDGILHDVVKLPLALHPQIVTRIKVLSKLRTDEHQSAQDGKISFKTDEEALDIRVSIVPTTHGETIAMRLLTERSRRFSLTDLGLESRDLEKVIAAYKKPYGMLLSSGPTGCGKTTTMYAILKLLNRREVNIMTIEDPVEYEIEGVNQIQVNAKTNLTFAAGLRSIVRQDPNIILVGEVRDDETAGIAINASMTGHLVLSTLHTNDAATALPRLLDMGIEPFLIASTVNIIIGQRLVRRICTNCRYSIEQDLSTIVGSLAPELLQKHFGGTQNARLYKGKGCPVCHGLGYVGRIGIFEILIVDEMIRQAIMERKDASQIRSLAIANGMTPMIEDGLNKVNQGVTTIDEVIRVAKE